ncbi:amino acid adenylation domain-containing protein [Micromonospora sp. NPDC049175]|uniref:amino acid adenylation domain-containing protein n=1 Tax=Micromonospora sp. NPDC049175 TaxID=3364266 RepID=UPI00371A50E5
MSGSAIAEILPLSPLAQGLLFHADLTEDVDLYAIQVTVDLRGNLDADRLRAAVQTTIERHETLRASFRRDRGGHPVQVIATSAEAPWREVGIGPDDADAALLALADEERLRPFDTAVAPLLRCLLVSRGPDRHRLVLTLHHLLVDGWSVPVLLRDLLAAYAGHSAALPRTGRYRDHLRALKAQDPEAARAAWRRSLAPLTEPSTLAAGELRSPTRMPVDIQLPISAERMAEIERWGRAHGLTLNTIVQGAWAVLLGALLDRRVVVFGATVSGRRPELPGFDQMVGLFINTVPVVVELDPAATLRSTFATLQAGGRDLTPYQHLGLAEIQEIAGLGPLFDSVLLFENYPLGVVDDSALRAAGLTIEGVSGRDSTHYPLTVVVVPGQGIRLHVAPEKLDRDTVVHWADRLAAFLDAVPGAANRRLSELDTLTGAERRALTSTGTNDEGAPTAALVPELIADSVRRHAGRPAVSDGDGDYTYAQFAAATARLARELIAQGVGPEAVVGIACGRRRDLVVAAAAVGAAGGTYLPLDLDYPADRIGYVLGQTRPALLIVDRAAADAGVPGADGVPLLVIDDPETRAALAARPDEWPGDADRLAPLRADHAAYVIYTSGSTGLPKGVVVSYGAIANLLQDMNARSGLGPDDRLLAVTTFAFDIAGLELLGPLLVGAEIVVATGDDVRDVDRLAELLLRREITVMQATPSLWHTLAAERPDGLTGLTVLTGGEAISEQLATTLAVKAGRVLNVYGPTETTVWSTADEIVADGGAPRIGLPIWRTRTYVLDRSLRRVGTGVAGELYIAGDGVARGYQGNTSLTSARFVADPYGPPGSRMYRTGDVCEVAPDGRIRYLGRSDNQVKIRGHRIELGEIEALLLAEPAVGAAVAHAVRDADDNQVLVAYVVPAAGPLDRAALTAVLAQGLPAYMRPSELVELAELPLTANGKVDRRALEALGGVRDTPATLTTERWDPVLDLVQQQFGEVLGRVDVPADLDFFAGGGQSLTATRLISRLRRAFDRPLPLRLLFENPTPRTLARAIGSDEATGEPIRPLGGDRGPLSPAQFRLWLLDQLGGDRSAYHVPLLVTLAGPVDVAALGGAFDDLLDRHEILRTVYVSTADGAEQVVLPSTPGRVPVRKLTDPQAAAAVPFDLTTEVPIRAYLGAPEDGRSQLLLLVMHHVAVDAGSFTPLLRDLMTGYRARRDGDPAVLPPLPLQFKDVAAAELTRDRGVGLDRWRALLAGLPPELALPYDRPRPDTETHRGGLVSVAVPAEVLGRARATAASAQATLFMMLQATVAVLYRALGAGSDIPLGVAVHGRQDDTTDDLVGMFVNTVVLRTDLRGVTTVPALLARVRQADLASFAVQDVPFEDVVEALAPERVTNRHPLFQTMLGLTVDERPADPDILELGGLHTGTAKFDVSFEFVERRDAAGDTLDLHLEYAADLFDRETAELLARRAVLLLDRLTTEPTLARVDALFAEESAQLLARGAGDEDAADVDLFARLARTAADEPARVGVVDEQAGTTLDYRDLEVCGALVAASLAEAGVPRGGSVLLIAEPGAAAITGILGVWRAGASYTPVDPAAPTARSAGTLIESGAAAILCAPEYEETARTLAAGTVPVVVHPAPDGSPATVPMEISPAVPGALAYTLFTSGSTGKPKGAVVAWSGMINHLLAKVVDLDLDDTDVTVHNAALTFDISVWQMFAGLLTGGRIVVPARARVADPEALLDDAVRHDVTVLEVVPSLLAPMLDSWDAGLTPPPLDRLRWLVVTGEALPGRHVSRWLARYPGIPVVNAYGPTECSDDVTHAVLREADPLDRASAPIGVPIRNTQLYVLDEQLRLCPPGIVGELYVGGAGVGVGYIGNPRLTATSFVASPFAAGSRIYRTGDNVSWRPDGQLEFRERRDHQVKVRGHRIELGEIEAAVRAQAGVRDVVVTAPQDERGANTLVAYVAGPVEAGALRAGVAALLPAYMVPAAWVVLDRLPLTPNGKVDRQALPAPATVAAERSGRPPRGPVEEAFCRAFADVIGVSEIGADEDFFAVGGDSIRAVRAVSAVRALGYAVAPAQVFVHRTAEALALALAVSTVEADDDGIGEVPLPPAVRLLRERVGSVEAFSQITVLTTPPGQDPAALEGAVDALIARHDALRMRLTDTGSGWRLTVPPVGAEATSCTRVVRLPATEAGQVPAVVATLAAEARRGLDPAAGRLVQVRYLDLGADVPGRLVLAVHHLAVDRMSWEILVPQLVRLWAGDDAGVSGVLTSYRRWASELREQAPRHTAELPMWREIASAAPGGLVDGEMDPLRDHRGTTRTRWTRLTPEGTAAALSAAGALGTGMEAVLLGVLGLAVAEVREPGPVLVELESHGRTSLHGTVDVSGTVGWFTSSFPLRLDPPAATGTPTERLRDAIRDAAARRGSVPHEGLGWQLLAGAGVHRVRPQISVNYLGATGATDEFAAGWSLAPERVENLADEVAADLPQPFVLAVDASLEGTELVVRWEFAQRLVGEEVGTALLRSFTAWWETLTEVTVEAADDAFAPLVVLQEGDSRPPLITVHGGVGLAWPYLALSPHLDPAQRVLGLQADPDAAPAASVSELAARYVKRIRAVAPSGPYRLLGWSFGGYVAHEMAVQLQAAGETVDRLAVLDIYPAHGFDDTEDDRGLLAHLLAEGGYDPTDPEIAALVDVLDVDGICALARRRGGVLGEFSPRRLRAMLATIRHHGALGAAFTPGRYDGPLLLVAAEADEPASRGPVDGLWAPHVTGAIRVLPVAARHDDLMRADVVTAYGADLLAGWGADV